MKVDLAYHFSEDGTAVVSGVTITGVARQIVAEIPVSVEHNGNNYVVTELGVGCFRGKILTHVSFAPESEVVRFGDWAFAQCEWLVSVELPDKLRDIGFTTFRETPSLKELKVGPGQEHFMLEEGMLYTKSQDELVLGLRTKSGRVDIPSKVKFIRPYAFGKFWRGRAHEGMKITELQGLENGHIERLGDGAFLGIHITSFKIPSTVRCLGKGVFERCESLSEVDFGDSEITRIPEKCFSWTCISDLRLPKSVEVLESRCFEQMHHLSKVSFEAGSRLRVIETESFYSTSVDTIDIPDSVEEFQDGNFFGCEKLTTINVGSENKVLSWDENIGTLMSKDKKKIYFVKRDTKRYHIPEEVEVISHYAFCQCRRLWSVKVPAQCKLREIGRHAFDVTSLKDFTVSQDVESIGDYAFANCEKLRQISFSLPSKLSSIGNYAFSHAASLQDFVPPDTVTSIGEGVFMGCSLLLRVLWPAKIGSIGRLVFSNCEILTLVGCLYEGDVTIHRSAFRDVEMCNIYHCGEL